MRSLFLMTFFISIIIVVSHAHAASYNTTINYTLVNYTYSYIIGKFIYSFIKYENMLNSTYGYMIGGFSFLHEEYSFLFNTIYFSYIGNFHFTHGSTNMFTMINVVYSICINVNDTCVSTQNGTIVYPPPPPPPSGGGGGGWGWPGNVSLPEFPGWSGVSINASGAVSPPGVPGIGIGLPDISSPVGIIMTAIIVSVFVGATAYLGLGIGGFLTALAISVYGAVAKSGYLLTFGIIGMVLAAMYTYIRNQGV